MAMRDILAATRRSAVLTAVVVLMAGLAATYAAREVTERVLGADVGRRFSADASDISDALKARLHAHADMLIGLQALYAANRHVDRGQFRRYVDVLDLSRRYAGFQALQFLRHVTPDRLGEFEAEVRGDNSADLVALSTFKTQPPGARPAYDVVEFVEPFIGNESSLGFDAGANPAQLDSLRRSAETGRIVATPPVKLVQDKSGGLGFIIRAPIYRVGEPTKTVAQRNAALQGFVASVYRANGLMSGILDTRTLQQMHIQVIDRGYARSIAGNGADGEQVNPGSPATLMYDSVEPNLSLVSPMEPGASTFAAHTVIFGERMWQLLFTANPGSIYRVQPLVPNVVLGSGVVMSVLAMLLVIMTMRWRRVAGHLHSLDAEQQALVDNPLAGILFTSGHAILRGNSRIAELCGHDPDNLPRIDVGDLMASAADLAAFDGALVKIRYHALATEVALRLRRKDGTTLTVAAHGRPLGKGHVLWVIEDKTEALAVEAERRAHAGAMEEANARLTMSLHAAEIRAKEIVLLTELSGVLQSCQSQGELFSAVGTYAGYLFAGEAGALYCLDDSGYAVRRGASWGELHADVEGFPLEDCRALHGDIVPPGPTNAAADVACDHADPCHSSGAAFVCQPLIAQDTLLGLLYREHPSAFSANADQLATMLVEQVSLAMANLKLREQLRRQALHDPLTDLHNRRFLEDALLRETTRSQHEGTPLALAMLDIDHFKAINDGRGHEAGDAVLRELGAILRETTRSSDIIGRFGGEEFLLLMPGADVETAARRAQLILDVVRRMQVALPHSTLDGVTLSIGVAVMPTNVGRSQDLLATADAALYDAKRQGRNRVVVSGRSAVAAAGVASTLR